MKKTYFNCHNHTHYSNIRLLDCINKPKDLIDKAIELGLSGIAITDHECLSAHMEVNQYAKKIREKYPDFKIALGNEIYLVDERIQKQKYYHFILIAKDEIGHRALRELSSIAWYNLYVDRGMERVPTLKSELVDIIKKYPNHLIATTACMGGELSSNILKIYEDKEDVQAYLNIIKFLEFCKELFKDDFYIECAPSSNKEQIYVNKQLYEIAKEFNIKTIIGTDSHYLTAEDRFVHKAYLNSKDGEREVDSFYEFAHLMNYEECYNLLLKSFNNESVNEIMDNTLELQNKISFFDLSRTQVIPKVDVIDYPVGHSGWLTNQEDKYPIFCGLMDSDNIQERYWANECYISLFEKIHNKQIPETKLDEYINRLEIEADIIKYIGNHLNDCLFAYFNTFKHYIDLFWECGSIVGPGRGSATGFLSNYLLGITQLDPIRWKLPYWRFLNKERVELPDIDIDLAPSKRPKIFEQIRAERGEFGLIQVATFGTEGTKSAILTACRGYRGPGIVGEVINADCSGTHIEGIDVDEAQYMSSLIPSERGFLWPMKDVIYGNPEKNRKPITTFLKEVEKYPGLLDIIISIEGLINKRSSHASGVILYGKDPFETASLMRTPSGDLITCYDLHKAESAGDTKYDFLVTEVSDKMIKCFELLINNKQIEPDSLRNIYNRYLHPEVIDTTNPLIWSHLSAGDILDVFQFNSGSGLAIAKKLKPQDPLEMTAANAMMRLMSEKGKESQQDRYVRIKNNGIGVFDKEMKQHGLPQNQIDLMHKHCDKYYGCCALQEQMMEILMEVANFTLGEANNARKIVGKKLMDQIPELRQQFYTKINNEKIANYIWEVAIAPQLGYAFSLNHSLPYSFVGIQTIFLATQFNPIFWNTACLIVNSGATEVDNGASTDYGKVAKAIGDIMSAGIKISLVDINNSKFGFSPDVENNEILFGLKGLLNVGDDLIQSIIENRPYQSPKDFLYRVRPEKQAMISLIKGGAFDKMADRKFVMAWYVWETCDKKKRLTLQNMNSLIKYNLLPEKTPEHIMARRIFEFNRYLKAMCKYDTKSYKLDERALNFLIEIDCEDCMFVEETQNTPLLDAKKWDKKIYQPYMDIFREWINSNKEEILNYLNTMIFKSDWDKYATGSISSWEMEVLCFYYHDHELKDVNQYKYGFVDFFKLPENPVIEKTFQKAGKTISMYKLSKICGTCIAKDKAKSSVTLLTTTGVVNVKFRKEYFSLFDKQISEKQADGTKKVMEKSWFNRGNMIVVMGIRSGDDFIPKKYASSAGHQLYKISQINGSDIVLTANRYKGGIEEDV